jgi:hypothetical protein
MENILNFIVQTLLSEIAVIAAGVLVALFVRNVWDELRNGGWRVVVIKNGNQLVNREISASKAKEIFGEASELAIFVKGVASPYGWLNCDPLEEGRERGLLVEDRVNKRLVINLDNNPPRKE